MAERRLAGKIALVTGGAGGIGRAAALAFAREGASVVVSDIDRVGGLATVELLRETAVQAIFIETDVAKEAQVVAMVERAVGAFGRVDCAFNNAGIEEEQYSLADCDEQLFDQIMSINVKGTWLCMKHEIRQMLKQGGGAIVNTASVAGLVGAPTQGAYAASKHAVVGMTKTAAVEYGRSGIRINSVCPGVIRTRMMEKAIGRQPERKKAIQRMHPIGRVGEASEVAAAVVWLCSDFASFVTGHQLAVDGGLTAI